MTKTCSSSKSIQLLSVKSISHNSDKDMECNDSADEVRTVEVAPKTRIVEVAPKTTDVARATYKDALING